ncbi:hypothetical protein MFMK1_001556 [Metallumcola ferriviriculae]|uniref:Uncharacterized protein n=1 Tax=Metallumcola ferriviriculae TaxID=3039180 RepID=A0AAU0UNG8_9FIRM|nr:hypothetical protein MFMK1_001556 [Desulfitibacteraceae bacterium MK1]
MKRGLVLTVLVVCIFALLFFLAYRSHPPALKGDEYAMILEYIVVGT